MLSYKQAEVNSEEPSDESSGGSSISRRHMSIFKRGRVYWYHFNFNGQHIQESTKQGNPRIARQIEAARKTALAKGEAGIADRKAAPSLNVFAQRFMDSIQVRSAGKPRTIEFYAQQLARLLDFEPLANARLSSIDEALVESFVQHRSAQVSAASVNRALATLRRLLRLAQEWRVIDRVPRIRMLTGERNREFVLSYAQESRYLESAPQPLRDVALLILDTGLRVGEALAIQWADVHLEPANGSRFGYIHIRSGKTSNAKRNVSITSRVRDMLAARQSPKSAFVFPGGKSATILVSSLDHAHSRIRRALKLPQGFVLHSLRHTFLTRLGLAGVEAFTIMKLAGHSSVTISQRYVHPTPEAMEHAFARLEDLNRQAFAAGSESQERQPLATVSATVKQGKSASS
jgi:integrase